MGGDVGGACQVAWGLLIMVAPSMHAEQPWAAPNMHEEQPYKYIYIYMYMYIYVNIYNIYFVYLHIRLKVEAYKPAAVSSLAAVKLA